MSVKFYCEKCKAISINAKCSTCSAVLSKVLNPKIYADSKNAKPAIAVKEESKAEPVKAKPKKFPRSR